MQKNEKIGKVYEFCVACKKCPIAVETKVGNEKGLEIKDDFGGTVKLTDGNLKDLKNFLSKRFSE